MLFLFIIVLTFVKIFNLIIFKSSLNDEGRGGSKILIANRFEKSLVSYNGDKEDYHTINNVAEIGILGNNPLFLCLKHFIFGV